jgi:hypothetical protein
MSRSKTTVKDPRYSALCHDAVTGAPMTRGAALDNGFEIVDSAPQAPAEEPEPQEAPPRELEMHRDIVEGKCPKPRKGEVAEWHRSIPGACILADGRLEAAHIAQGRGWKITGQPAKSSIQVSRDLNLRGDFAIEHAAKMDKALQMARDGGSVDFALALLQTPQGALRPASAARIAAAYAGSGMSLAKATRLLGSLPVEQGDPETGAPLRYVPKAAPVSPRALDLRLAALRVSAAKGAGPEVGERIRKLEYAQKLIAGGTPAAQALAMVGEQIEGGAQ